MHERRDEAARGGVHVERHIDALPGGEVVERGRDPGDRFVGAVERAAEHGDHADRVLVAQA
jgi:hypothetical protein